MVVTEFPMVNEIIFVQFKNAPVPIDVTDSGIVTVFKRWQCAKRLSSIEVRAFGSVTDSR